MAIFGWEMGDIIAIYKLAAKVYAAYEDAPSDYRPVSEEVMSLQTIINTAIQHFESNTWGNNDWQLAQEVLEGCQSALEDLNLASANGSRILKRAGCGAEDITTLRASLTSNAVSLNSFIQRFDIPTTN